MKSIKKKFNKYVKVQHLLLSWVRDFYTCCVCMDVCFVLFLVCLSTCVCVYLQVQGPLRECLRAGRFRASPLLHPTCVRSCCNWRASCVATKQKTKFLSAVIAHLHLCPLFLCIYIPILTCTYFPTDWFWLRGWLIHKGATCTGTAPLFWNFIAYSAGHEHD